MSRAERERKGAGEIRERERVREGVRKAYRGKSRQRELGGWEDIPRLKQRREFA